jgi:hypothetical protein
MKYIKDCPECGKKIRFPLDRGRIRIHCQCGYSAIVDPDDTSLYNNGKFDLSEGSSTPEKHTFPSLKAARNKKRIINSLLETKYKIQNFRYLPDKERNKFIAAAAVAMLATAAVIYFL